MSITPKYLTANEWWECEHEEGTYSIALGSVECYLISNCGADHWSLCFDELGTAYWPLPIACTDHLEAVIQLLEEWQ